MHLPPPPTPFVNPKKAIGALNPCKDWENALKLKYGGACF